MPGKSVLARPQLRDEVVAHLVLDGLRGVAGGDELSEVGRAIGHETPLGSLRGCRPDRTGQCAFRPSHPDWKSRTGSPGGTTGTRARERPRTRRDPRSSIFAFDQPEKIYFESACGRHEDEVRHRLDAERVGSRKARFGIQNQVEGRASELFEESSTVLLFVLRHAHDMDSGPAVRLVQALQVGPREPARRTGRLEEREEERETVRRREKVGRRGRPSRRENEGCRGGGVSDRERSGRTHARV